MTAPNARSPVANHQGWASVTAPEPGGLAVTACPMQCESVCPSCIDLSPDGRVLTICTSMRYLDEAHREGARLTAAGYVVLMPFPATGVDVGPEVLRRAHVALMRMSHGVHIVCPGGYMGPSVRAEIRAAQGLGLPVTYSEPPSAVYGGQPGALGEQK